MEIKEFIKEVPQTDTCILYIHGILGTPYHFRDFFPLVKDYSQVSILLDGHGGSAKDFSKTKMIKWKSQVSSKIEELKLKYAKIYVVAHSMGTLFAIDNAIIDKHFIAGIFLLNVPIKLKIKARLLISSYKVFTGHIKDDDIKTKAARDCYGINKDFKLWRYFGWIPRYLELFKEIKEVRNKLNLLTTPCICFQSNDDEMVSNKSSEILSKNKSIKVFNLPSSTHFYYEENDKKLILDNFLLFINK